MLSGRQWPRQMLSLAQSFVPNWRRLAITMLALSCLNQIALAQTTLTWAEIRDKFEATNPTLKAARLSIDEARAAEITAYLRPNPTFTFATDGTQIGFYEDIWRPFSGTQFSPNVSYLHERQHKRELRLENAKEATEIAVSSYSDQERGLIFNLQSAFIQILQAKAVLQNAIENLEYWDKELAINRRRLAAGDLAQIDVDRLELQRVQFESDFETATVNLRTAKIQLLTLLDDRTPIAQFDVTGLFDYTDSLKPLDEFRDVAVTTRPDLKVAVQSVDLAKSAHQLAIANGSTDPTFSLWYTHNPSFSNPYANNTLGGSFSIPLRIFDRNQGEKLRTQIDIGRNQRLLDATQAQVFSDVDSAYVTLVGTLNLLRPYKAKYLQLAAATRDKVAFAYQHGGASLLDYLDAEKAYRDTKLAYVNLVGAYLTAVAQMNMAAGREVMQ